MQELFEQLKHVNQAGVYLLVSLDTREVYINHSSNIAKSLVRLLSSNMYFPKFNFNILELVTDPINLRPRCQFYKDLYSSNGYTLLNPKRVSNWKLYTGIIDDFTYARGHKALFTVTLVSGSYKRIIVAVYSDYEELQEFLRYYYPANLVTSIIYADNDLTKEYRKLNEKI